MFVLKIIGFFKVENYDKKIIKQILCVTVSRVLFFNATIFKKVVLKNSKIETFKFN